MAGRSKGMVRVAGGLVALIAAFAAVYLVFFRGDDRAPAELSHSGSKASVGDPVGTWEVVTGANTFAGYRVREKLASLPAQSDAVGRTGDVSGSFDVRRTADGYTISKVEIEANLTTVRSDRTRRDDRLRTMGLETDRYPNARFEASDPVEIPARTVEGDQVELDLEGDLTIHGVTKRVTIPVEATVVGDEIEVVGSLTFPMADFSITPPNIANIVSVEPDGTMEFKVRFAKRAA